MPDADGNLTSMQDFIPYREVRLHSALDNGRLVLAMPRLGHAYVHRLEKGEAPEETIFQIRGGEYGFVLAIRHWDGPHSKVVIPLTWCGGFLEARLGVPHIDECFQVDMVDRCWFALNNQARTRVADVAHGNTAHGSAVVSWPWNGGENQKWRAQIVTRYGD